MACIIADQRLITLLWADNTLWMLCVMNETNFCPIKFLTNQEYLRAHTNEEICINNELPNMILTMGTKLRKIARMAFFSAWRSSCHHTNNPKFKASQPYRNASLHTSGNNAVEVIKWIHNSCPKSRLILYLIGNNVTVSINFDVFRCIQSRNASEIHQFKWQPDLHS